MNRNTFSLKHEQSPLRCANPRDVELKKRREIPYFRGPMYYPLYKFTEQKERVVFLDFERERVIISGSLHLSFEPEFVVTSRWILIRFLYLFSLGDIQYDLEEAAQVRMKLVKMYETVDILRLVTL